MNKTKYLALAFAALTLGACTSDDVVSTGGGKDDGNATGYMSFAIHLPTVSGDTRAGGWNDASGVFDDGEEGEYAVKDARVYFINSEGTIIQTATPVLSWNDTQTPDDNVTRVSAVVTLESPLTDPASVLVVLNPSNKLKAVEDGKTTYTDFNAAISSTKASDFYSNLNEDDGTANNIMMCNAPIVVDGTGGAKVVQTLVPISEDDIYKDENESVDNPVTVYVERVLAKVSITQANPFDIPDDAEFEILGWDIDNTNTKTFPVRKTDFYAASGTGAKDFLNDTKWALSDVNRFYGTATDPVRTYFAEDPNYSSVSDGDFTLDAAGTKATLKTSVPSYCLENTFSLDQQIDKAATFVRIKATYQPKPNQGQTYTGELDGYTKGDNFFIMGSQPATIYSAKGLAAVIVDLITETGNDFDFTVQAGKTASVNVEKLKEAEATDKLQITAASGILENVTGTDEAYKELTDALAIKVYEGGVNYYPIAIKHFGDKLTPWTGGSYGTGDTAEKNYLGRYGVVRNNWYEINITGVSGPGDPVPPTPGDEQIDKDERFISFTINILSWAKRTQDVEL